MFMFRMGTWMNTPFGKPASSPGEEGALESVDDETVTIQWPGKKSAGWAPVGLTNHSQLVEFLGPVPVSGHALYGVSRLGSKTSLRLSECSECSLNFAFALDAS